jgi:hypothetical protein
MKKIIALLMTLALMISAVALPALAEETAGAVDQVTSVTQNARSAKGGRNDNRQTPGNGQMPQMPGQNGQNSQAPGSGVASQMPGQNVQNGQNGQLPGGFAGNGRHGKDRAGQNGQAFKGGKQLIFDQLLADGVITQEVYDAITAWMNEKMQQAQPDTAAAADGTEAQAQPEASAPAEGSEPPALPDGAPAGPEAGILKSLLDDGVITQEQYDLYLSKVQAAPAAPAVN